MKRNITDISFNSIDSTAEIPLLKPSNDEEDNQPFLIRHNKTAKRVTGGFLIAVALYLLWKCWRESDSDFEWMLPPALGGNHHYGVDYSWPIHGPIVFDDNPWYHDRHRLYLKQLEGCRAHYGKISKQAARTCDVYEYDRILMNRRQPQSMQNYTKVGFQKVKAPRRVRELVQDFWDQNQAKQVPEQWPEGNVYLNHWDSPSYMVSIDDAGLRGSGNNLKRQIWAAAQSTISQWTSQDVTPVSMYGIRVYTNGSLLIPHVDRLPLVASAMVNVAQDVDEDWPIEMYDHTGQAHNVTLHPGDMLLFESHAVIHGRPFPMKGRYYSMLFIHFEPTGKVLLQNGKQSTGLDEQYRQAINDGVGGQSSSEQSQLLPPYIRRFSPEEEHWQKEHPEGWVSPVSNYPAGLDDTDKQSAYTSAKGKSKYTTSKEHKAAREGDLSYWKDALKVTSGPGKDLLINKRDAHGWQPIHESAANGQKDVVKLLLRNGADVNSRTNGGRGGTPLFLAEQRLGPNHSIVSFLKERGALSSTLLLQPHQELELA